MLKWAEFGDDERAGLAGAEVSGAAQACLVALMVQQVAWLAASGLVLNPVEDGPFRLWEGQVGGGGKRRANREIHSGDAHQPRVWPGLIEHASQSEDLARTTLMTPFPGVLRGENRLQAHVRAINRGVHEDHMPAMRDDFGQIRGELMHDQSVEPSRGSGRQLVHQPGACPIISAEWIAVADDENIARDLHASPTGW